jgi:hypothetical protein
LTLPAAGSRGILQRNRFENAGTDTEALDRAGNVGAILLFLPKPLAYSLLCNGVCPHPVEKRLPADVDPCVILNTVEAAFL